MTRRTSGWAADRAPGAAPSPDIGEAPAWLAGARVAPSAHNTQPWLFTSLGDGRVAVGWDPRRALPAGDPSYRDLYLALGAAVESARLRADAAGTPVVFVPAPDEDERIVGHLVPSGDGAGANAAEDRVDAPGAGLDRRLAALLDDRRTARAAHLDRPIPPRIIDVLRLEAVRLGRELYVVTDRAAIRRLAALARRATAAQFADPAVHAELWRWLRLEPADPAYRRDGLTADCLDLRGVALAVARLAMPPVRMRALVRLGAHHLLAADTERVVRRSASLCLLVSPSARREAVMATGGALQRLWLLAAEAGLTTHPVSALLDCAGTIGPAVEVFGAGGRVAASLYRMGYTDPAPRAPRLPAGELLASAGAS